MKVNGRTLNLAAARESVSIPVMASDQPTPRRGFTLVELLVSIAIIGVLMAFLLPMLARAKAKARRVKCVNQLGQVGKALISFAQDNDNRLPWQLTPSRQLEMFGPQRDDFSGHPAAIFSLPDLRLELGSAEIVWSPCDAGRESAK